MRRIPVTCMWIWEWPRRGIFEHGKPYLDAGFDGYWGIEYASEGENSYACAEYQLAAVKRFLSLKK